MTTLFISDLHLTGERPEITKLFLQFLQQRASTADALYILGDLFEAWLGDDMILPDYQPVIDGIKQLVSNNVPVFIMHGNRDFLMSHEFEKSTGATLLPEAVVIDLYGTKTLLMHGDTLCTDDVEYQKFRAMVRNPAWQQEILAKTPQERLALAKKLRETSETEMAGKSAEIMDVNQDTVEQTMRQHNVKKLIHGHTHRPAIHDFLIDNIASQRIVLGDWYEQGSVLTCNKDCILENL